MLKAASPSIAKSNGPKSGTPVRIFDAVRELIALTGVVVDRDRRELDSTVLDDAVARQST